MYGINIEKISWKWIEIIIADLNCDDNWSKTGNWNAAQVRRSKIYDLPLILVYKDVILELDMKSILYGVMMFVRVTCDIPLFI